MGTIQHDVIAALDRHPPRAHAVTSHSAAPVADRGKYLRADPSTGVLIFATVSGGSGIPSYAGDPVGPTNGDVWYDSSNDRLRVKLAVGKGTIAVMLDP